MTALAVGAAVATYLDLGTNSFWARELAIAGKSSGFIRAQHRGKAIAASVVCAALGSLSLVPIFHVYWIAGPVAFATIVRQMADVGLRGARISHKTSLASIVDRASALLAYLALTETFNVAAISALECALIIGPLLGSICSIMLTPVEYRSFVAGRVCKWPWSGAGNYALFAGAVGSQNLDLPLLTLVAGPAGSGMYAAVSRWTQPMGLLASSFSTAAMPFMASASSTRIALRQIRAAGSLLILAMVGCVGVAALAPWLVPFLVGNGYGGSVMMLQILGLGTIPAICSQALAALLQARRDEKFVARATVIGVCCQLLLIAPLVPLFGPYSAAIAFGVAQLAMATSLGLRTTSLVNRESVECA